MYLFMKSYSTLHLVYTAPTTKTVNIFAIDGTADFAGEQSTSNVARKNGQYMRYFYKYLFKPMYFTCDPRGHTR